MLAADGTVGSCDGAFDVAQRGVDPSIAGISRSEPLFFSNGNE
jgi:hypothetical protein